MNKNIKNLIIVLIGTLLMLFSVIMFGASKYEYGYKVYNGIKIKGDVLFIGKISFDLSNLIGVVIGLSIVVVGGVSLIINNKKQQNIIKYFAAIACGGICFLYNLVLACYYFDEFDCSLKENRYHIFGMFIWVFVFIYGLIGLALEKENVEIE
ncbi:MAG: hypothetical protein K5892_07150 [Acholeplasmatales bacterium]|nr:hypothetical protein [Acholeplasmatales bacterium]